MRIAARYQLLFAFLLFFILSVLYYHEMVAWLPGGIHNWAQADRYALALNFYDRGLNFFKPATNSELSADGIVAPEFPLLSYLAACLAKIFGRDYISILFRLITLSFSAVAFIVIFKWGKRVGGNFFTSLLSPVFLFTSPVFIFYSCNYLPDTASVSLVLVSFYYLYLFSQNYVVRNGLLTIFFAGLATLIKMSSGIYFAVICLHGMIIIIEHHRFFGTRNIVRLVSSAFIAILVIGLYFLHIREVEKVFHSGIFLSATKPVDTDAHSYSFFIKWVMEKWKHHYFTPVHYALLIAALAVILFSLPKLKTQRFFFFQWILNIVAAVAGFLVMGEQFYIHDYYVLAIFFPAVLFSVIFFVSLISNPPFAAKEKLITAAIIPAMIAMCVIAYSKHKERMSDRSKDGWFTNLKTPFDNYNIGKNEKILITSGNSPNVGLVHADRHGLTINPALHEHDPNYLLKVMRLRNLKYLVIGPLEADSLNRKDSCFFKYMDLVVSNEEVVIYRYKGTMEDQYWSKKAGIDDGRHQLTLITSFECPYNCKPKSPIARTGDYSILLNKQLQFMPQLQVLLNEIPDTSNLMITAKFWTYADTSGNLNVVTQSVRNDSIFDYQLVQVPVSESSDGAWREVTAHTSFPTINTKSTAIQIYLWNTEGISTSVDDFVVEFGNKKSKIK